MALGPPWLGCPLELNHRLLHIFLPAIPDQHRLDHRARQHHLALPRRHPLLIHRVHWLHHAQALAQCTAPPVQV